MIIQAKPEAQQAKLKIHYSGHGSESMQSNYIMANNIAKQSMKYSGVRSSTT